MTGTGARDQCSPPPPAFLYEKELKMITITLKGREIPLLYTVWEMKQISEEIAPIAQAINIFLGRNPDDPEKMDNYGSKEQLDAIGKVVTILGNAGLEDAGKDADLTEKWVLRAIRPSDLGGIVNSVLDAMNDGMASEIPAKQAEGPVDAGLEEMERKKKTTA